MDRFDVDRIAQELMAADRARLPIEQLSATSPDMALGDAYRVQQSQVETRIAGGETIVGWKVGLTSAAMQQQLGVDQPDYGPVLSGWHLPDGATIDRSSLIAPRVEAEIGFLLKAPLQGPGVTAADVLRATESVTAAIEVIDSRIRDWKLTLVDTVADMASCARVLLGSDRIDPSGLDLRLVGVALDRDGEVVETGAGAAVLGDPVAAVAWAANTLGPLGVVLEAGQFVIPGAMHASVPAEAGQTFRARFDRLGSVTVRFV
jgi:2-keto-4-pentenoate hydratase